MTQHSSPENAETLLDLQRRAGIPHLPTQMTYEARLAVSNEGPRAYDWQDKPHRLVYDLCLEIEWLSIRAQRPEDHKWFDPECGQKGCQSLVWKSRYESAVKGRQEFRQAYREARDNAQCVPDRETLIHTICPHIKVWSDADDVPDKTCQQCPATVQTSRGEGVQMCRLNAQRAADAILSAFTSPER